MKLYISSALFLKIKNKLESELDSRLFYHNWGHTNTVLEYVGKFAESCKKTEHERYLLQTAALFHDTGYLQQYENNEEIACRLVCQILPEYEYSADEIDIITRMIMATALGVVPASDLEKLLCDADLAHIASDNYFENSSNLRREMKAMGIADINAQAWADQELKFLLSHSFYMPETEDVLKIDRNKNIEKIKDFQKGCQVSEKSFSNVAESNIKTNRKDEHMKNQIWEREPMLGRRTCMLMITHACNLNCTYCYEKYKSNKTMSFELAKELILKECQFVQDDPRFHELEIDLMGGEPMMNFELIKQLVEWTDENPLPVPWIFFITTNGTLFDEEKKAWFRKYKHLIVAGASYDGTTEMQRKNRDTATNSIDMEFFHQTWPTQGFHMTISQETLPHLAEGILEMQRNGYPLDASLAQGVDWTDRDAEIYYEQLQILSDAYLKEPELVPVNLLSRVLSIKPSNKVMGAQQDRWCGSGTYMITYDVDGRAYGCHMFTTVVLGDEAKEKDLFKWDCAEATDDPYCDACILKMACPTCVGFNYRFRGDIAKRDHQWCKMVFAEKFAACEFQIKLIALRRDSFDKMDAAHARGALEAYDLLKSLSPQNANPPFVVVK